jgi:hypothetical protein
VSTKYANRAADVHHGQQRGRPTDRLATWEPYRGIRLTQAKRFRISTAARQ